MEGNKPKKKGRRWASTRGTDPTPPRGWTEGQPRSPRGGSTDKDGAANPGKGGSFHVKQRRRESEGEVERAYRDPGISTGLAAREREGTRRVPREMRLPSGTK